MGKGEDKLERSDSRFVKSALGCALTVTRHDEFAESWLGPCLKKTSLFGTYPETALGLLWACIYFLLIS